MENTKKKLTDLFLDKEYIEFYKEHRHKQNNIVDMLEGNKNRMCVCDTEEELYIQYFAATVKLQELLRLQKAKFKKQIELGYEREQGEKQ